MSNWEPTYNLIYQPIPSLDFKNHPDPPIYSVQGPDVPYPKPAEWYGITKLEAQKIADKLNLKYKRSLTPNKERGLDV